jgi:hypothetical protein
MEADLVQSAALWAPLPLEFPPVSQVQRFRRHLRRSSMSLKALDSLQLQEKSIVGRGAIPSAFPRGMSISTMQIMGRRCIYTEYTMSLCLKRWVFIDIVGRMWSHWYRNDGLELRTSPISLADVTIEIVLATKHTY